MTEDTSVISQQLRSITADLRPAPGASPDDLHRARVAIASALAASGTSAAPRSAPAISQAPAELTQAGQQLLDAAIQEPSSELLDQLGRPVWVDLYRIIQQVRWFIREVPA